MVPRVYFPCLRRRAVESSEKANHRTKEGKGIDIAVFFDVRSPVKARGWDIVLGLERPYWVSCFDPVADGDGRVHGFVSRSQTAVVDRRDVLVGNLSDENDGSRIRRDDRPTLGRIEIDLIMVAQPLACERIERAHNRRPDVRQPHEWALDYVPAGTGGLATSRAATPAVCLTAARHRLVALRRPCAWR